MDSQPMSFSCPKSNHIPLLLHSINYPESTSPDLGLRSTLLEWNARRKIAKIGGFELFNEGNTRAVTTFTLLVGTSLLLMVLI